MKQLLIASVVIIVLAILSGEVATKECANKGGVMVYAGKMQWCKVEQ